MAASSYSPITWLVIDDLGRGLGDPPAGGVDGRLGVGERVVGVGLPGACRGVGFVAHVCYPSWGNSA